MTSNELNMTIPLSYRKRLNSQKNKLQMSEHIEKNGIAVDVFRYTIGLGEVHFKNFMSEFEKYISDYPWIKRKNVKFIMSELLINTQFAMLREFLERVKTDDKFPAFFYLTFFINDEFFSAGIDEYGDYFNYNDYFDKSENFLEQLYSTADLENAIDGEKITSLDEAAENRMKVILKEDNSLMIPDGSNKLALPIIENATNHDFFISSFYKENKYMWKRIYFRVENDL